MRKKLLGSLAALVAGGGLAWGQSPPQPLPILPPPAAGPVAPAMPYGPAGGLMPAGMMPPPAAAVAAGMPGLMDGGGYPGGGYPGGGYVPPADPTNCYGAPPYGMGPDAGYGGFGGFGGDCAPAGGICEKCFTRVDYLMWWTRPANIPIPLVTTSSPIAAGRAIDPTSFVLFGGEENQSCEQSGIRVTTGLWCDCNRRWGVELSGFLLEDRSIIFEATSDANGFPVLARPFTEAISGAPSALLISFPGFLNGAVVVDFQTRAYGAEGNTLLNLYRSRPGRKHGMTFNLLGGFRWFALEETLDITSRSDLIAGVPGALAGTGGLAVTVPNVPTQNTAPFGGVLIPAPATIAVNDRFYTKNNFYGLQLGTQFELRRGKWTLTSINKVAVGYVHQILDINGASALSKVDFTNQAVVQGGLFALSSNIGRSGDEEFGILPEATLQLGCQVLPCLNLSIGYNVLYLNRVIRPGDQLNPLINSTLIPTSNIYGVPFGPLEPQRLFNQTDVWIQGINFSIGLKF